MPIFVPAYQSGEHPMRPRPVRNGDVKKGVRQFGSFKTTRTDMIIVPVKEGENIEKCLKKFKRKFEKTGAVKELRRRQQFDAPSQVKRVKMERAIYVQHLREAAAE